MPLFEYNYRRRNGVIVSEVKLFFEPFSPNFFMNVMLVPLFEPVSNLVKVFNLFVKIFYHATNPLGFSRQVPIAPI